MMNERKITEGKDSQTDSVMEEGNRRRELVTLKTDQKNLVNLNSLKHQ